ncbi:Gfo/Idh/MocA family protein [Oceanobacillus halophilus]|uniref:Gfo/Idh/MocA family oxidoreductase n=1 Tax=Oceanobacillus halophilus TaxID=930130 RepID=A0A495A875_9BACI|nr:Gfo/Idh/MocA family oxidoreductase [Oceanobacillus halophilus]RKQ35611.1 gfo/Idh/MocA family oxidoreductase [Oceanobacillus halophilus]
MNKLKMGIIGTGGIAQARHIPSYLKLQDKVEIVAVYDINQPLAETVAEKFQIPYVFDNYHDLLVKVDAVTICTPNKFHAEISIAALEAGVHVLCEKPMAMNAEEGKLMIEAARKANKLLSIAYHYRFLENTTVAKQASLEIGDPLVTRVQALRRRKVPGWGVFTNKELQGGGSLIDFGCHLLDLSLWLLDEPEPLEVTGTSYNRLSKLPNQVNDWGSFDSETFEVDDHVTAYIKFSDYSSLLFECSWAANIKEDYVNVSISGVDGGLNVFPYETYQPKNGKMTTTTAADLDENHENAGYLQAKNFVESCLGEAELISKPEQALKVTKIIDAIYKSSETGESVRL